MFRVDNTAYMACNKIYAAYGKNLRVTKILTRCRWVAALTSGQHS